VDPVKKRLRGDTHVEGTTHQNQRKGYRLPVKLPYSLVAGAVSREFRIHAESINLSKFGMRVRTEAELTSGQTVEVILLEVTPRPVVARVVWVGQPAGSHQFEFGLEYVIPSPRLV